MKGIGMGMGIVAEWCDREMRYCLEGMDQFMIQNGE